MIPPSDEQEVREPLPYGSGVRRAAWSREQVFGPGGEEPLLDELASVALTATLAGGRVVSGAFGRSLDEVATKSSSTDMVTEVDRASEEAVVQVLSRMRPEDGVLGEEGASSVGTSGVRWVLDPLDGTTNYLYGLPAFAVSLAAEAGGETLVGIVLDPLSGETWTAIRGRGARLNGRLCGPPPEHVMLSDSLMATGFSYSSEARRWQAAVLAGVLPRVRDIRRFGSAALDLCWVAGGRFDGYFEWGMKAWDVAAGSLICEEAGRVVRRLRGGSILAAAPPLVGPLESLLIEYGVDKPPAL